MKRLRPERRPATGRAAALAVSVCLCVAAAGCTNRAWFEGFKASQRQQCYRKVGQDEIQQCLDRVNGQTYDDYKRAREETGKGDR